MNWFRRITGRKPKPDTQTAVRYFRAQAAAARAETERLRRLQGDPITARIRGTNGRGD